MSAPTRWAMRREWTLYVHKRVNMPMVGSSSHLEREYGHFNDPSFTADISRKMTVPKKIKMNGDADDVEDSVDLHNSWFGEKFEMHVPDRILAVGEDQHLGTKALPPEILLDNAVMPPDPGLIRVQTPPRIITLDEHYYPTADYNPRNSPPEREMVHRFQAGDNQVTPYKVREDMDQSLAPRDWTPMPGTEGEGLTTSEEIMHLRRQLAKLNRRVMAVELDNMQRQQRDKVIYAVGAAYVLYKVFAWMCHSN